MTPEIEALERRLAAAERVCYLFGISAARAETEREKATTQAWMQWSHDYMGTTTPVGPDEIARLAAERDEIVRRTRARIAREAAEGIGQAR